MIQCVWRKHSCLEQHHVLITQRSKLREKIYKRISRSTSGLSLVCGCGRCRFRDRVGSCRDGQCSPGHLLLGTSRGLCGCTGIFFVHSFMETVGIPAELARCRQSCGSSLKTTTTCAIFMVANTAGWQGAILTLHGRAR